MSKYYCPLRQTHIYIHTSSDQTNSRTSLLQSNQTIIFGSSSPFQFYLLVFSQGKVFSGSVFFFSCKCILKLILTSQCFSSFWSNKLTMRVLIGILLRSLRMDQTDFFCSIDSFLKRTYLSFFFSFIFCSISSLMSFSIKFNSSLIPQKSTHSYLSELLSHGGEVLLQKFTVMPDGLKWWSSNSHPFAPPCHQLVYIVGQFNKPNVVREGVLVLPFLPPYLNQVQTQVKLDLHYINLNCLCSK